MQQDSLGEAELVPHSAYVRDLRPHLPDELFQPARSRLALVPLYMALATAGILALASGRVPWFLYPLLSIGIGTSFACLTFIAHDAMHGGIVRGRTARMIVGWIGFLPFTHSPRLWAAWHDRIHHATANTAKDPDGYPTYDDYRKNSRVRFFIDQFSPGGSRWRGAFSLILGFTGQSMHQLLIAKQGGYLKPRAYRLALLETAAGVAVWATLAVLVGLVPFLFAYVLPLLVANAIVMAFILTNHSLSPRVSINDPLASGLSVTTPRWIELLTLQFGYHVEHHVFPAMSSRHARAVRALLQERWPERYQSMPLGAALLALHRTSRVYKDAVTLVDPRTGREFPTLMPRETAGRGQASAAAAAAA